MEDGFTLERAFEEMERRAEAAGRAARKLASALAKAHRAGKNGDLHALRRALQDSREALELCRAETETTVRSWPLDEAAETAYFESGAFTEELLAAAKAEGLPIAYEDGQLLCYPSLLKVDPNRRLVTVDKKPHKAVRPSVLTALLQELRTRPARFKSGPFLESVYRAWDYARHLNAGPKGPPLNVRVDQIYSVLTVAPGSAKEYSKQEFGRDLYSLEKSGDRLTKRGARIHFSRSTGTKAGRGVITVVGEDGRRIQYSSISFIEGESHDT